MTACLINLILVGAGLASSALGSQRSLTDSSVGWPTWSEFVNVLALRDHNTRVVMLGVGSLGLASGIIGSFMLLRKRALLADALSHATLPGIGTAFIVMAMLGGEGKWLPGLLAGATLSGILGVAVVLAIVHLTRIKEDAALGIVLSVFFGLGVSVMGVVQSMGTGSAAGLESFIYGKTASMLSADAKLIVVVALITAGICALLMKEFSLLCFDHPFSASLGRSVLLLDVVMMALVVTVTVIGLQAVGLILMVALLIIPPAAARFWTDHLPSMVLVSAVIGALSGLLGAGLSALVARLPAGAVIVLVAGAFFGFSMVFGTARGVLFRWLLQYRLKDRVARQHLLRALYEGTEPGFEHPLDRSIDMGISEAVLLKQRTWGVVALRRAIRSARREGLVLSTAEHGFALTAAGWEAARRVVRNHRLWELFLITHADIAPSHVDRDADEVEHVLEPSMIQELETLLAGHYPDLATPASPHGPAPRDSRRVR